MSGKKLISVIVRLLILAVMILCSIAAYVYTRDFGVDYKGRARLDYNWKYYFAKCPKKTYEYSGKLFSFSYLSSNAQSPMRESIDRNGGSIYFDDYLLDVDWFIDIPAKVRIEIVKYMSFSGIDLPSPSLDLSQWLLLEFRRGYFDSSKVYTATISKVALHNGGTALLIQYLSKVESQPHRNVLIAIAPTGEVIRVRNTVRLNASEATYRERVLGPFVPSRAYPDAERDAQSACTWKKFIETFELKNPGK